MSTASEIQLRVDFGQKKLGHFRSHFNQHVFSPLHRHLHRQIVLEVLAELAKAEIRNRANAARKELGIPLEEYK